MSVKSEIERLNNARAALVLKMMSAGYEIPPGATVNTLIDSIVLKSLDEGNILPDTDTWSMYNGKKPAVCGGYRFEHTFDEVWGGYYYYFDEAFMQQIRGKTVVLGVKSLSGLNAKIEMVCDGAVAIGILRTATPQEIRYTVSESLENGYIRAVVYGEALYCAFEGIYLKIV